MTGMKDEPMTSFETLVRRYDVSEIIADGIVHGVGVVSALIAVTALIFYATVWGTSGAIVASWIYGLGLVASLGISFAYNIWPRSPVKWFLRRLDHSAIFILIAATYTPFLVAAWPDPVVVANLIGLWCVAAFGIALKCIWPGRFDKLTILLYLAMGWSGVAIFSRLYDVLSLATLVLILIGGIIYTVGVIFHVWEKLRFQNAIWHAFVVTAAGVHYAAVLTCVVRFPG
jgi:hemolysin III